MVERKYDLNMTAAADRRTTTDAWRAGMVAAAFGVALLTGPTDARAAQCTAAQQTALDAKLVQTELMVAALACGERAGYNAFIQQNKSILATHGKALKSLFRSAFGAQGEKRLNTHVTRLANQASARQIADVQAFCGNAAKTLQALNAGTTLRIISAAHPLAGTATADACQAVITVQEANAEQVAPTGVR